MKNLLSYDQFNEQYLPYFGVKQALDDSKQFITNEEKTTDFHRVYTMNPTWWVAWKKENGGDYGIKQDAFSKTYEVSKGDKIIFIFDYNRNKIFTNESPELFVLKKEIEKQDFEEIKDKAEKIVSQEETPSKEEKEKKESPAEK